MKTLQVIAPPFFFPFTANDRYLCPVSHLLDNPVYQALYSGDAALSLGSEKVRYFDEAVSPFVGFSEDYADGFQEFHRLLPQGRRILFAAPYKVPTPEGWQLFAAIEGLQFVFEGPLTTVPYDAKLIPLQPEHAPEMVALAALTKPGPFGLRTIEFGHYYGIFEQGRLAAMTGQRLHIPPYTEISAVCTHPDYLGKGFATALLQHQLQLILGQDEIPFLHVRADNERAIAVYERLGFKRRGVMNFYFLQRS